MFLLIQEIQGEGHARHEQAGQGGEDCDEHVHDRQGHHRQGEGSVEEHERTRLGKKPAWEGQTFGATVAQEQVIFQGP